MKVQASAFDVIYTPEKSGTYGIYVYCGNIPLNGNHSLKKEVRAGTSLILYDCFFIYIAVFTAGS